LAIRIAVFDFDFDFSESFRFSKIKEKVLAGKKLTKQRSFLAKQKRMVIFKLAKIRIYRLFNFQPL
jgi:hypothetical protein